MRTFEEYRQETNLNEFVDYLLESGIYVSMYTKNGEFGLKDQEPTLKNALQELRQTKNAEMKNGLLGDSLYIRIKENKKTKFFIRASYHAPYVSFGSEPEQKTAVAILAIDLLSWADELKIHQIKEKKHSRLLNDSGLKDKGEHKRVIYKKVMPGVSNLTFVDLETDDYQKVKDCIKNFLQENNIIINENMNYDNYSVEYEIVTYED